MPLLLRAKKSLGQNFLRDPHYLNRIAETAGITKEDRILEIGPGLGHLTGVLAARSGNVLAIEIDDRLIPLLQDRFQAAPNVTIVHADALAYDYSSLEGSWKVVANLPYYISTPIIQRLIEFRRTFSSLTLMLQKEVALRIASPPGSKEYGFLSVFVQFYTIPRIAFTVPPACFSPRPEVDSTVITLTLRERPAADVGSEENFVRIVKAAFSQRRKTLRNSLKQLGVPPGQLEAASTKAAIDLSRRAETLTIEEFARLADALLT